MKFSAYKTEKIATFFLLILILIFALLVRALRAKVGLPYLYFWDEPQTASNALQMLKTGNFNPHFFAYGTLTIYINYLADVLHYFYLMGQPEDAKATLNYMWELQTVWDTKWHWTISHPSFYYWNRMVNVLFGTGTVLLVYCLAKNLFGYRWIGLVGALSLAVMGVHVGGSAIISPDIPTAFFVVAVVFFSLLFVNARETKHLICALIFSGCAVATKYNSALVVIVPAISVFINYMHVKADFNFKWIKLLFLIPPAAFFICMPYALFDSAAFLHGIGSELRHYKVFGHGGANSEPGWPHMIFQFKAFQQSLGSLGVVLALLGTLNIYRRPKLLLVLLLPTVYFLYMIQMKVNFHRNLTLIYPFFALLYGSACDLIYATAKVISEKYYKPSLILIGVGLIVLIVVFISSLGWSEMRNSLAVNRSRDSRTIIIDKIDGLKANKIYIASELRIHDWDMKRLSTPHQSLTLSEIYSCPSRVNNGLVLLPAQIGTVFPSEEERQVVRNFAGKLKALDRNVALIREGKQESETLLDIYSTDPELLVLRGTDLNNCTKADN